MESYAINRQSTSPSDSPKRHTFSSPPLSFHTANGRRGESEADLEAESSLPNDGSQPKSEASRDELAVVSAANQIVPAGSQGQRKRGRPRIRPLRDPSEPKKKRGRPRGSFKVEGKSKSLLPRVVIITPGEDVAMAIFSISQMEGRACCVLSANGSISSAVLRDDSTESQSARHEGNFEILSLSGSFVPNNVHSKDSRMGGLSVSLAGAEGSVFGGGLAGTLIAASPVQIVLGMFQHRPGDVVAYPPSAAKSVTMCEVASNPS